MAQPLARSQTTQALQDTQPHPIYTIASRTPVPTVLYITTAHELNTALQDFEGPYGFDCEWKCMPVSRPIALVQLSNGTKVLLIHVSAMPEFPTGLKSLLEDATVAKVGVFVEGDGKRLQAEYNVTARNLVNLGPLAWHVDVNFSFWYSQRGTSLAKTVLHFLGQSLPKGPLRLSNWEREPLTEEQREYAAGDAHCAHEVYILLLNRATSNHINLHDCRHVVDMDTVIPYEFPDSYPLKQHLGPSGLSKNEYHAYIMWYHGYSALDIQQTMTRYQVDAHPTDEAAVISLIVNALAKDTSLPFQPAPLRTFVEGNSVASMQHEAFLAARCPAELPIASNVVKGPLASSSTPVAAGNKRKARASTSNADGVAARSKSDKAAKYTPASVRPILRRSRRLQSTSSQESVGRAVKRRRTTKF